jgi:hypothetical protein
MAENLLKFCVRHTLLRPRLNRIFKKKKTTNVVFSRVKGGRIKESQGEHCNPIWLAMYQFLSIYMYMNVPPGEEVTDPFVECALTLNHIYQIYEVSSHTTIKAALYSTTSEGLFQFSGDNDTIYIGYANNRFWLMDEEEQRERPYAHDSGNERYVRIFKDVSEYEPGMIKGGYKKRGRKTRRTSHRKRACHTRRRRRH